jgi:hypothetical protein
MKMFFSPSNKGFFSREVSSSLPFDAIEISKLQYEGLLKAQADGKVIVFNETSVTAEVVKLDAIAHERQWRDAELVRTDFELYKTQDGDIKSFGSVADWRSYRKLLRSWPEHKDFPNKDFRPVAPDA